MNEPRNFQLPRFILQQLQLGYVKWELNVKILQEDLISNCAMNDSKDGHLPRYEVLVILQTHSQLICEMELLQLEPSLIVSYMDLYWNQYSTRYVKLLFHLGSQRSNNTREIFRLGLSWLAQHHPLELHPLLEHVPKYGCWSDLNFLLGTPVDQYVISLYGATLENDRRILSRNTISPFSAKRLPPLSLAAKWCPSQNGAIDKATNFTHKLCLTMNITASTLRKDYLTPLRRALHVTETLMCANKWKEVDYNRVPRNARLKYHNAFMKHDSLRYSNYLNHIPPAVIRVGPDMVDSCINACLLWDQTMNNFTGEVVGHHVKLNLNNPQQRENESSSSVIVFAVDCSGSCAGLTFAVSASLIALLGLREWHRLGDAESHPTETDTGSILKFMLGTKNLNHNTTTSIMSIIPRGDTETEARGPSKENSKYTILVLSDVPATYCLNEIEKLPQECKLIHWCCCHEVVRFNSYDKYLQISGYDTHLFNLVSRNPHNISIEAYLRNIENDPYYTKVNPLMVPLHLHSQPK